MFALELVPFPCASNHTGVGSGVSSTAFIKPHEVVQESTSSDDNDVHQEKAAAIIRKLHQELAETITGQRFFSSNENHRRCPAGSRARLVQQRWALSS